MSDAEYRDFVTAGTRTAKWANTRRDGRPHVVPVWFVLDGDDLLITTGAKSVKGRAVLRDPRVALCIDDDRPPYAFVLIEGCANVSTDPDEVLRAATLNARRYVGAERAEEYGQLNGGEGMLLVRITPEKVVSENNITGETT
jgi:PPOX class probable F420-dependent enzyme